MEQKSQDKNYVNNRILIKRYLQQHSLVESNIISFNDFIERRLQEIIDMINDEISREEVELWLGKIYVGKPEIVEGDGSRHQISPIEARLRKITYSAPLFLEISSSGKEFTTVELGKIPVMVKSKYCNLSGMSSEDLTKSFEDPQDPGGYFIINGNERIPIIIEDLAQNQPFSEITAKGHILRVLSQRGSYRIPITINETPQGEILVSFSRFKNISAILLAKALGLTKDSEIAGLIAKETESLIVSLSGYSTISDSEDAVMAIGEKMSIQGNKKEIINRVRTRIDSAFLPHIGTKPEARREKVITLCKLIKQFLISKEMKLTTDRDHYANKRLRLSGDLLADLFRVNLNIFVRDLQHSIQKIEKKKKFYPIKSIAKATLFQHRIESSIATGSWIGERAGVTQNMDKTNGLAVLSQLQRVVSSLPSEQENFKARTLHPTHYGRFCPVETPEGTSIGLRKNLAMMAKVSTAIKSSDKELLDIFEKDGMKRVK
jgi:DNA-directed RNA polymerase subunit B